MMVSTFDMAIPRLKTDSVSASLPDSTHADAPRTADGRSAPERTSKSDPVKHQRPGGRLALFFYLAVSAIILMGLLGPTEIYVTPENGLGYMLGIIGGAIMLSLFLYPLRKKWRPMRRLGPVKYWFMGHMILGVAGPVLVLFHANFELGSTNSRFAMFSMLLVAGSGLVGRYIYNKIHHGLYGRKATLQGLRKDLDGLRGSHTSVTVFVPALMEKLEKFEASVLAHQHSMFFSFVRPVVLVFRIRWSNFRLRRFVKASLACEARKSELIRKHRGRLQAITNRHISRYLALVRQIAELNFYERLFSLWHLLHYPLFLALLVSATVHIVAVHMY